MNVCVFLPECERRERRIRILLPAAAEPTGPQQELNTGSCTHNVKV